ncbi:MAG: hypothetical protein KatS3mg067_1402 [Thermosynechococcus sp.]|uniref:hypothetical protein n=1 Tax=Thermosynechococcus sp. TaxID=2814275 RepID=UPI0021F9DFBC|nr:hypothetical protein [Thermosynechococcus sp.]BCX12464.1 MAG: hypothetical protein KatS3mg067_1402 [Thermosynechococcus sp.]
MRRLLSLACILGGFYFIAQNIIFHGTVNAATATLLSFIGVFMITSDRDQTRHLGYWVLALAAFFVFFNARFFSQTNESFAICG